MILGVMRGEKDTASKRPWGGSEMGTGMSSMLLAGALLAILSGLMNGSFTLPMRFLGKWDWENVWTLFIVISCLLLPAAIITVMAPQSWTIVGHAPPSAIGIAILTGFAWGFGAVLFGQSVSAIGISLARAIRRSPFLPVGISN